jgi:5-methylcytosine-specific restriction protein A
MRREQERQRNARRYAEQPHRKWYGTAAWRNRRRIQLSERPLCEECLKRNTIASATVADHNPPHNGVWAAFIAGPLRSLCKPCHDTIAQREQKGERLGGVDATGRPTALDHYWNRASRD